MACNKFWLVIFAVFPALANFESYATDAISLRAAYEAVNNPSADSLCSISIKNLAIKAPQLNLYLDSGMFYFFRSLTLDTQNVYFGGYFKGQGRFEFDPLVSMEREQLRKFFDSDSLSRSFENAELYFGDAFAGQLLSHSPKNSLSDLKPIDKEIREEHELMSKYGNRFFDFQTLRNLTEDWPGTFLSANLELKKGGRVLYRFDPSEREEVKLYKQSREMTYEFFEMVCSYHEKIGPNYKNINGDSKNTLAIFNYDIDAVITDRGKYIGRTDVSCRA
ncbi:MAG: hypothetical protein ACREBV_10165, partial [Candidatus Zixiibacteriota bacterium]